jgi:hypothetical protein
VLSDRVHEEELGPSRLRTILANAATSELLSDIITHSLLPARPPFMMLRADESL